MHSDSIIQYMTWNTESVGDSGDSDKPVFKRVAQLLASICVMTGVTVVLGYGGGLLLAVSAKLGGPDPETADGDPLRDRLLDWPQRNREFMKNNGEGEFPWQP